MPRNEVAAELALRWGLLAMAAAVPLAVFTNANDAFELTKQVVLRCLVIVTLAAAIAACWTRGPIRFNRGLWADRVRRLAHWQPAWVAGAILGTWLLSLALSIAPVQSWWGTYERWAGVLTELTYVVVFLLAAAALRGARALGQATAVMTGAATLVALYALIQRAGADPFNWTAGVGLGYVPADSQQRPFSTLGNPSYLAAYLAVTLPLALAGFLRAGGRSLRLAWASAGVLQLLALVFSQARGGWVGVAIGLAVFGLLLAPAHRARQTLVSLGTACGLALVVALAVALAFPQSSLVTGAQGALGLGDSSAVESDALLSSTPLSIEGQASRAPSVIERETLWTTTAALIVQRPIFGYGPDTLNAAIMRDYPPSLVIMEGTPALGIDRAHSATLDTLVTTGLVGGLAIVGLIALLGSALWRLRRSASRSHWILAAGAVGALVSHIVEQQFNVDVTAASTSAWLLAGGVAGWAFPLPSAEADRSLAPRRWAPIPVALAGGIAAGLVLWQARQLSADASYAAGLQLEQQNNPVQALPRLQAAVATWPLEPTYWNELAKDWVSVARAQSGTPDQQKQAYQASVTAQQQTLALAPATPLFWSNFGLFAGEAGVALGDNGLIQQAEDAHDRALALGPDFWLYWRDAGVTSFRTGQYATAEADFNRAVGLWNDPTTLAAYGDAAAAAGDLATAREAYRQSGTPAAQAALQNLPPAECEANSCP